MNDRSTLAAELKNLLIDNDGEVPYWGAPIVPRKAVIKEIFSPAATSEAPPEMTPGQKAAALEKLRVEKIGDCRLCPLGETRIKLAFGVGNPDARVMFVGEGPGYEEDRRGEPFVGKAGQLLDKIMAAIGLDRTIAYIANVVKCHPMVDPTDPEKRGNDRPPAPEEMDKCLPFLKEQIEIIRPRFLVTLGATATKAVLRRREGITALRGKILEQKIVDHLPPFQVLPTFHPAALLRDPNLKKAVWEDMKLLRDELARHPRDGGNPA